MAYYKNNRNHNKSNNYRPSRGQNYVWVVYSFKHQRNHTFTSKVKALKYYYNHEMDCAYPRKYD